MGSGRFYLREILAQGWLMIALTDEEVLGMEERDDEKGVRIIVSKDFYGGELVDEARALEAMRRADVLILTGDRIIELAIRHGYVNPESVLRVGRLSHTQVFKFSY